MSVPNQPPSPCVRNCCLNEQDICLGCMRTLQEILDWHRMSPVEKQQLLIDLPKRRQSAQFARKPDAASDPNALSSADALADPEAIIQPNESPKEKRCFIGIDLPESVRAELAQQASEWKQRLKRTDLRWIPSENYHLTLAFLGNVNSEQLERLGALLQGRRWLSEPLALRINAIGGFPSPRRSRYVVAHVGAPPQLHELYRKLQSISAESGLPTEQRDLMPHITLARGKSDRSGSDVPMQQIEEIELDAGAIVLFESRLFPSGSQYSRLAEFK